MARKKTDIEPPSAAAEGILAKAEHAEQCAAEFRGLTDNRNNAVPATPKWLQSTDELIESYDPRAIPQAQAAMHGLDLAHRKMLAEHELRQQGAGNEADELVPSAFYWLSFDQALESLRKKRPLFKRPASPLILSRDQRVSPRQIAHIYKFYLSDGTPDEDRVLREIEKPGCEVTPEVLAGLEHDFYVQCGFVYVEPADKWEPAAAV